MQRNPREEGEATSKKTTDDNESTDCHYDHIDESNDNEGFVSGRLRRPFRTYETRENQNVRDSHQKEKVTQVHQDDCHAWILVSQRKAWVIMDLFCDEQNREEHEEKVELGLGVESTPTNR